MSTAKWWQVNAQQNFRMGDSSNLDAFSRVRVSNPTDIFHVQTTYDAEPLLMESGATGSGTTPIHSANTRMVALTSTSTGTSYIQSYEYVPYQPGKSQLLLMTGVMGNPVAGATVDFGLFDAENGVFFRQNGTSGMQVVTRTSTSGSVVNNAVDQADWNLDKMDGTGPSGIVLDSATCDIFVIDAQYLSMGRVRFGFDIAGEINYVHEFLNANVLAVPYMQSLTLPVQALVTTTSGAKTAYFKCASISSEGGFESEAGYVFSSPETTVTAGSGSKTHIHSVRPGTTFNSIANRGRFTIQSLQILVTGTNAIRWELCIGSTFSAAPTFSSVDATYSSTEYSSSVGTLSSPGIVIAAGYVSASASTKDAVNPQISSRYPITLDRAGSTRANGTLSLIVTGVGGSSATRASMTWKESR